MVWIVRNVQTGEFISGGKYSDYMLTAFQSQAAKFATREVARIAVITLVALSILKLLNKEKTYEHKTKNRRNSGCP